MLLGPTVSLNVDSGSPVVAASDRLEEGNARESSVSGTQDDLLKYTNMVNGALEILENEISKHGADIPEEVVRCREELVMAKQSLSSLTPGQRVPASTKSAISSLSEQVKSGKMKAAMEEHDLEQQRVQNQLRIEEAAHAAAHTAKTSIFATPHRAALRAAGLEKQYDALSHKEATVAGMQRDRTIERDAKMDFSDKLMGHTADGHAVLAGNKKYIVGAVPPGVAASSINTVAQFAAKTGFAGMDAHAAQTSTNLTNTALRGHTAAQREAAVGEMADAAERRLLGEAFVRQEVRDRLGELGKRGYQKDGMLWGKNDLSVDDVMAKLEKNGWAKDRSLWERLSGSNAENSKWSDALVKKLDRDKDGQLSTNEIQFAMEHTKREAFVLKMREDLAKQKHELVDKAEDYGIKHSPLKLHKQVTGLQSEFQKFDKTFDLDHDGKVELNEITKVLKGKGIKEIKDANHDGKTDIKDVKIMFHANDGKNVTHPGQAPQTPAGAKPAHAPAKAH